MSTPGKSGASFFISNNDKLLIKTLTKEEFTTLHTLLPKLYQHTMQHPNTMLCQFYGVYRMMLHTGVKVRMVVMSNILCTTAPLHRRFDLKGSTQGRYTKKTLAELKPTSILKDLDLDLQFKLPSKWLNTFNEQLHADSLFLEAMGLIDYSMLVGVHFRDAKKVQNASLRALRDERSQNATLITAQIGQGVGRCYCHAENARIRRRFVSRTKWLAPKPIA
jgi:1-phosphatidylinositol-4-phosphate 5-kinase